MENNTIRRDMCDFITVSFNDEHFKEDQRCADLCLYNFDYIKQRYNSTTSECIKSKENLESIKNRLINNNKNIKQAMKVLKIIEFGEKIKETYKLMEFEINENNDLINLINNSLQ
jgi:hypothetical protein